MNNNQRYYAKLVGSDSNTDLALLWPLVDRYREAGLTDVTVRVYEDARHEILNETNRSEVIDDLLEWLQRVSALPAVHDA